MCQVLYEKRPYHKINNLKYNVVLLKRLIVIRQSVDTCFQTDFVPISVQTPNLASLQSAVQHSF